MTKLTGMRLLVVEHNADNVDLLEDVLGQAGYVDVIGTQDPEGVVHLCKAWNPDLVLLEMRMPKHSGYEVMAEIRELMVEPENLPVLAVSEDVSRPALQRALSMGARDFIGKPIDPPELLLRVRNLLQTRQLQKRLREQNAQLDEAVRQRTLELEQARLESLTILASVTEYRRITAVADVFDALTHERPYKPAWEVDRAIAEITNQTGRQFDPLVIEAFLAIDPRTLPIHDPEQ